MLASGIRRSHAAASLDQNTRLSALEASTSSALTNLDGSVGSWRPARTMPPQYRDWRDHRLLERRAAQWFKCCRRQAGSGSLPELHRPPEAQFGSSLNSTHLEYL